MSYQKLTSLSPYRVGGSLNFDHPCYVQRQADLALLSHLSAGEFCYVFNCRQMGKSSLRVRTMHHLQAQGHLAVAIDITSLGSEGDPHKWYNGLISQLFLGLALMGKFNLKAWLRERDHLSPLQKLGEFIEGVLLVQFPEQRIFIFIDEIDKVLSLPFALDDFFSYIRYCYNQRADRHEFNRLAFALFGVATPADLIQNKTQTPFNIGHSIELTGFTFAEIAPLAVGLELICGQPLAVLENILSWTGGQPFLTQKLCDLLLKNQVVIPVGQESQAVDQLVQEHLIRHWETQDEPIHLRTIRDRLLRNPNKTAQLLGIYQNILTQGFMANDDSPEQTELRLTGLVVKQNNTLQVYNRLYGHIFNATWVGRELEKLRPYSESFLAWVSSHYQDQSRLLRGQALKDALIWAHSKALSPADYRYLNASQLLEQELSEQANQILRQANHRAQRIMSVGIAVLIFSLLIAAVALRRAHLATIEQERAQQGTQLQHQGETGDRQFSSEQINALLTTLKASQELQRLVTPLTTLQDYPATSPLLSLQKIMDQIQEKNILTAHQDGVNTVAWSPDGETLATGARDNTIKLWTNKGQLIQTLRGHQGSVYRVVFSPDGETLASASQDNTIKLWTNKGQLIQTLRGHQGSVYALNFSPDGSILASAGRDKTLRLWNLQGQTLGISTGHGRSVDDVKFSPDGRILATISRDGQIRLWTNQGKLIRQFGLAGVALFSLSFSPDGQTLAVGGDDGTVRIWDRQGTLVQTLGGNTEFATSVLFSPSGEELFAATSDGSLWQWNRAGKMLSHLRAHNEAIFALALQGQLLATASEEGTVKIWDLSPKTTVGKSFLATSHLVGATVAPPHILLSQEESPLRLTDLQGDRQKVFPATTKGLIQLRFSPQGYQWAGQIGNTIQIWTLEGQQKHQWQIPNIRIYDLQFSPRGNILALATRTGTVQLWQIDTPRPLLLQTLEANNSQAKVRSLSFNPQTGALAAGDDTGQISLWTAQGKLSNRLAAHSDGIYQVRFSAQGDRLISSGREGSLKVWSSQGNFLDLMAQEPQGLNLLAISGDGQWVAGASQDGRVRLWDKAGQLRGEFAAPPQSLMALSFSLDSQSLLTLTASGRLRTWALPTELKHLQELTQTGCDWLTDYFALYPAQRQKLPVCTKGIKN